MAEYIEREKVYPIAKQICDAIDSKDFQRLNFGMRILDWIDDLPAADVRPVVRGHIVDMRYAEDDGEWRCTHCGWQYTLCVCGKDVTSKIRFCPNCGADMRPTSMSGANEEES